MARSTTIKPSHKAIQRYYQALLTYSEHHVKHEGGNRSALDWVIDQYQVSEDKRSGIRSDPNRAEDEEYIVRLVGQVVRVSLETVRIVAGLPEKYGP